MFRAKNGHHLMNVPRMLTGWPSIVKEAARNVVSGIIISVSGKA